MRTGPVREEPMPAQSGISQPVASLRAARRWFRELRHRPLLLCCVALMAGMLLSHRLHPGVPGFALVALGAGVVIVASGLLAPRVVLAPLLVGFVAVGGFVYEHGTRVPPTDLSRLSGADDLIVEGTVITPPEEGGWQRRARIVVESAAGAGRAPLRVTGRAEARIPREPALAVGDRVRLLGASVRLPPEADEPGEFCYREWLARQGVRSLLKAREAAVIGVDRSPRSRLARIGMGLRERVVASIEQAMPGVDSPLYSRLLVGMVYGLHAAPLPEEIVEQFRRAGTVHLLVVSGAQISMIAIAIVGLTGGSFRRVSWWQATLASAGVLVLVMIVGMEASVGRAVAMFALVMLAALTGRDYDVYTGIAVAAAVILLFDPRALLSLSMQLTFAATLGVVIFLPDDRLRRLDGSIAAAPLPQVRAVVWGTFGAWVFTSPLLAYSFSGFALSGNLANLANVPLSVVVLALGFVALPVALVPCLAPLLPALCWLARGVLALVMHVNELAAALPVPFVEGMHLGLGGCVLCYALIAALLALGIPERMQGALDRTLLRIHPSWPVVIGFALVVGLVCTMALAGAPPRELEVTLLPVGAGQCAVVRTPAGTTLMVDCGGGGNFAGAGDETADGVIVPWLTRRRIRQLDVIAISHWDADHCNALPRLMRLLPVGLLLAPPELPGACPPEELAREVEARARWAVAGGRLALDESVTVEVLAPRRPLLRRTVDDANANSLVMMITHGDVRVLLTGDIESAGIARLIRDARSSRRPLRADVLVLPHHGRQVSEALLEAVRPEWAVASCDRDADRYLAEEQMGLLASRGIRLLRTDEDGAITLLSDGRRVRVSSSRGPRSLGARIAAARG